MNDIISIVEMMGENGFTWQETITISLAIIGSTLSILILVQGGVAIIGKVLETINISIQKIKPRTPSPKE